MPAQDNIEKRTMSLVEDEPLVAIVEKRTLEKAGYTVITASTGEKALEIVRNDADRDLILMDIDLDDGIDGTEAAEQILKDNDRRARTLFQFQFRYALHHEYRR